MKKLKFGLKSIMIYERFEVQIIQEASNRYQVMILEIKGYSYEDPFFHIVDTRKTLGDARDIQDMVFNYMMDEDFRDVKKKYFRMQ